MHRHRPSGSGAAADDVREVSAARDLDAGPVEHPRGPRAESAVHEHLQAADAEDIVAEAGYQADRGRPLQVLVRDRLPDAQRERALLA